MKILLLLMLSILGLNSVASPDCDYDFSISNVALMITENSQIVERNIIVSRGQNSPNGRCAIYRVFFGKGAANSYTRRAYSSSGQFVNYNLHRASNQTGVLKDFSDAININEFIEGEAPSKNTNYLSKYYAFVPGFLNNSIPRGIYSDNVQVSIYGFNQNSQNYNFEETTGLTVFFYVPTRLQISLVDEGDSFNANSTTKVLDFGLLQKNQQRGADLRVVSNSSYKVNLSSANGGKLKGPGTSVIHYGLKVNGSNVALPSSSTSIQIGAGSITSEEGDRFNLKFQILDETRNLQSGNYQDNLIITAIAN